jgi:predicted unusual protein kinase regulating ubiquinone biosynthesis (AarF/ABC1/UbiB family)
MRDLSYRGAVIGTILLGCLLTLFLLSLLLPTPRRVWVFNLTATKYFFVWIFTRKKRPELMRLFAEDMGPTFIKFGQIVASSSGMFPDRYVEEFRKCLDRVRPFAYADVDRILGEDLGDRRARLADVDPKQLASASIAQVHTATLDGNEKVVIKVQRPGIKKRIRADMRIMRVLAWVVSKTVKDADLANPVGIVDDFAMTLDEELDFRKEAQNLDRFNEIMKLQGHTDVRAPKPILEMTTPRVLVMERFFGTRVDDAERIRERGVDAEAKLIKGMQAWFQCVLFHGFFHGDVHAGNLMLLDNEDVGFLDFGIVGRFSERQRVMVTDYIVAFATGDFKTLARVIHEMGGIAAGKKGAPNQAEMATDLEAVYAPMLKKSFAEINYAEMLPKIQRVSSKHRMYLPREFVLITKQMLYFDRYAKLLAPKLNVFTDPRLVASMMADVMKARMAQGQVA